MKRRARSGLIVGMLVMASITHIPASSAQQPDNGVRASMPIQQLRIYEIFESNSDAFHARFRSHAVRIMRRYDFKIQAMWETEHNRRKEFVYLLEWPDEKTMVQQWAKFMADAEWSEIKQKTANEHGKLVGEIESRVLRIVPNSPEW